MKLNSMMCRHVLLSTLELAVLRVSGFCVVSVAYPGRSCRRHGYNPGVQHPHPLDIEVGPQPNSVAKTSPLIRVY